MANTRGTAPGRGVLAEADHQEQGGKDDAQVTEHVLPEDEMREADRQIGGEEALEGARQTPEVGQLDQHRDVARSTRPPAINTAASQRGRGSEVLADQLPATKSPTV